MRKKDDAKKELILNYIHEYYGRFGKTPVVLEIASGTAISSATVHRYLVAMNESGELNYTGKGSIHTPKEEENIIEYIRLPESLVGKGEFFALIAKGHSMMDIGVDEGDCVIVRKQNTARVGDIVVALYDGGLNNLKKLCYDEDRQRCYLYSCNADQETYAPIYVDELQIQGVAVCTVHNLEQE